RGVVVAACQTVARSGPSAARRLRSCLESTRGRSFSRRASSVSSAEALFPRTLEAARDEPVVGIYGAIAALGEACHVARPLDAEPPVLERGLAIHLQLLSSSQRRCDLRRLERCNEGACHGVVDLYATDVEAIAAAPLDEMLSRTVVTGRRVATPVVCAQTAATMFAAGEPLEQCAAFPAPPALCGPGRVFFAMRCWLVS